MATKTMRFQSLMRMESRGLRLSQGRRSCLIRMKSLLILLCVVLVVSCSMLPYGGKGESPVPEWLRRSDLSRVVVVLPFENLTSEPDLEMMVRQSFYSQFAPKNYRDIELNEVDRALEILRKNYSKSWKDVSPQELGSLFGADFLIYGTVLQYSRLFAAIYSQVSIQVQVEMIECSDGREVWRKTASKRSHDGGVPFSLFGAIPEAVRSGMNMSKGSTLDLIERLNREIVAAIPEPPVPGSTPYFLDVQVGSFLLRDLASEIQGELLAIGFRARIETMPVGEWTYYRVLLGPYKELSEAEDVSASVSKELGGKPILIQHHPGRESVDKSGG